MDRHFYMEWRGKRVVIDELELAGKPVLAESAFRTLIDELYREMFPDNVLLLLTNADKLREIVRGRSDG